MRNRLTERVDGGDKETLIKEQELRCRKGDNQYCDIRRWDGDRMQMCSSIFKDLTDLL